MASTRELRNTRSGSPNGPEISPGHAATHPSGSCRTSSDSDTGHYERPSWPVSVEVDKETYTYVVAATSTAWESTLEIQGVVLTYTLP